MFELKMNTSNAAFCDPNTGEEDEFFRNQEVARILEQIAYDVRSYIDCGSVRDTNGNKIGTFNLR